MEYHSIPWNYSKYIFMLKQKIFRFQGQAKICVAVSYPVIGYLETQDFVPRYAKKTIQLYYLIIVPKHRFLSFSSSQVGW